MRIALGIIFFWFGALKTPGYGPVTEIVRASFPFMAEGTGNIVLAIFEILIGLGLIFKICPQAIFTALTLHLLGTFSVFILAPEIMFDPNFPYLSLDGEFVVKNLALVMGGFIVFLADYHLPKLRDEALG